MIWAITRKELLQYARDGRLKILLAVLVAFTAAATLHGRNTVQALERERINAGQTDREVWNNQGPKNPHSAAHFSRYVFPPTSSLALFDPGLTPFVGRAVWLEAHYRDPATLRPVEDAVEVQRLAQPSPAWILQVLAPLLIVLFAYASISGERDGGTLRYIQAMGARAGALYWGKALALLAILLTFVAVAVGGVFLAAPSMTPLPSASLRLALLAGTYFIYLCVFAFAAIAVSAQVQRSRTALLVLVGFWAISSIIAPRLAPDIAAAVHPGPQGTTFWSQLSEESSDSFWSKEAKPRRDRLRDEQLEKYGVTTVEELPFNFDGFLLQASEEVANEVFDRRYGELWEVFERQHRISLLFSVMSPTLAVTRISRGLSGTDLYAHQHFTDSAETFRRTLIKGLNQDMIDNAGKEGYGYLADRTLWEKTPDFDYRAPPLLSVGSRLWPNAIILLGWLMLAGIAGRRSVEGAFVRGAAR